MSAERHSAPINERALLTKQQAADYLSVSLTRVKQWIANGDIRPTRIGSSVRLRRERLDELIDRIEAGELLEQKLTA